MKKITIDRAAMQSPKKLPWHQNRLKPTARLLIVLSLWALLAIGLIGVRLMVQGSHQGPIVSVCVLLWWLLGVATVIMVGYDFWLLCLSPKPRFSRTVSESLSLSVDLKVLLQFFHSGNAPVHLLVHDHFCQKLDAGQLPLQTTICPNQLQQLEYVIKPLERGDAFFYGCEIWIKSPLGFLAQRLWFDVPKEVRIYPNFAAIAKAGALGVEAHMSRMGIHLQQRRGQGMDFKQLRSFQVGDQLRDVDWKATSKRSKPIVREYQDEQGQDIIFMLDCGRSMRTQDDGLSHFDTALNAVLMVAYTALRQGDRIGLQTFAGQNLWQPPVCGVSGVNTLLQRLYNLECTTSAQDYLMAAQQFMARHAKRAVIIIVTNLRLGLEEDLLAACRLLSQRHVVCLVSVKERVLTSAIEHFPEDLEQALTVCCAANLVEERERRLKTLRHQGVVAIEAFANQLHHEVIRQYQALKRSGRA